MPTTKQKDAIALLKEDHKNVKELFEELEGTTGRAGKKRQQLITKIITELTVHATVEEEIFYPRFKEIAGEEEETEKFFEAAEEHHLVKIVMAETGNMDVGGPEFSARTKVLKELVEHHVKEEEREMFKIMRRELDREELVSLGEQIEQRKMQLKKELGVKLPRARAVAA